jgi:superoxide dismutase, Cu-Zn family
VRSRFQQIKHCDMSGENRPPGVAQGLHAALHFTQWSVQMIKVLGLAATTLALAACNMVPGSDGPTATANLRPTSGSQAQGQLTFTQLGANRVRVTGTMTGLSGTKGFHVHEKGDCSSPDATSAGEHFNPGKTRHGATPTAGHVGDMGNIVFSEAGRAAVDTTFEGLTVSRDPLNGIIGRAVIVHSQNDDLKTDPSGDSGGRAACGVIG